MKKMRKQAIKCCINSILYIQVDCHTKKDKNESREKKKNKPKG